MQLSLTLKDYHLGDSNTKANNLKTALSHGDFCPWNMLEYDGKIRLIDWELAAERPLGHDLFTYIVQTSLLLTPECNLKEAIKSNEDIISEYFSSFGIENYKPYLKVFVEERYKYEVNKGNDERANRLNEIIE